jgi:hypothetical protein
MVMFFVTMFLVGGNLRAEHELTDILLVYEEVIKTRQIATRAVIWAPSEQLMSSLKTNIERMFPRVRVQKRSYIFIPEQIDDQDKEHEGLPIGHLWYVKPGESTVNYRDAMRMVRTVGEIDP